MKQNGKRQWPDDPTYGRQQQLQVHSSLMSRSGDIGWLRFLRRTHSSVLAVHIVVGDPWFSLQLAYNALIAAAAAAADSKPASYNRATKPYILLLLLSEPAAQTLIQQARPSA